MTATVTKPADDTRAMPGGRSVVVGVDNTTESDLAIAWAAREAFARSVPLHIVRTYTWPPVPSWSTGVDPDLVAALRAGSERIAERALRLAVERVPGVRADELVLEGRADDVLIEAGKRAGLIVLGGGHLNLAQRLVVGSVSGPVTTHAQCPVVVVRGPDEDLDPAAEVVVGVTDRPSDSKVLRFAFDYASRHGTSVHAVLCWHRDLLADAKWRGTPPAPESAERLLAETLAGWRTAYPDVPVHAGVVRDHAAAGLVAASSAQRLLVVGRPHHRLACGAVPPSVTHTVLRQATCPVAVVPTG